MGNYDGEGPITALRNAGIGVLANTASNYLTQLLTQKRLENMALLANQIKTAENAGPEAQQAILGNIAKTHPGILAKLPAVLSYAPPGLESSVDTPNPLDQLLSTQSSPTAFQRLSGAVPITKGETIPAIPGNIFATAAPELKQQVANQVAGTPGGAIPIAAYLAKIGTPTRPTETQSMMEILKDPNIPEGLKKLTAARYAHGNPGLDVQKFNAMYGPGGTETQKAAAATTQANAARTSASAKVTEAGTQVERTKGQVARWQDMSQNEKDKLLQTSVQGAMNLDQKQQATIGQLFQAKAFGTAAGVDKADLAKIDEQITALGVHPIVSFELTNMQKALKNGVSPEAVAAIAAQRGTLDAARKFGILPPVK